MIIGEKQWNWGNRIKNMVWTVGGLYGSHVNIGGKSSTDGVTTTIGDPQILVKTGMTHEEAINVSLYTSAHEGAHHLHSDVDLFREELKKARKKGYNVEAFNDFCQIIEDARVDGKLMKMRPGYTDMRKDAITSLMTGISPQKGQTEKNIAKALSLDSYGVDLDAHPKWKKAKLDKVLIKTLAKKVQKALTKDITQEEGFKLAEEIYTTLYPPTPPMEEPDEDEGKGEAGSKEEKSTPDTKKDRTSDDSSTEGEPRESSLGSGEDGDASGEDVESEEEGKDDEWKESDIEEMVKKMMTSPTDMLDTSVKEKLKKEAERERTSEASIDDLDAAVERKRLFFEKKFGVPIWTEEERKRMERRFCKDIHAGSKLLYVDSAKKGSSSYDYVLKHRKNNKEYNKAESQARQFESVFREMFRAAKDEEAYSASSGKFSVKRAHKVSTGGNTFTKTEYIEEGGFVVDVVLDASGSMSADATSLALSAYSLTKGLQKAGVKVRVVQFRNEEEYQVIERLKDYEETNVDGVLLYNANGENRDGLALGVIAEELLKRQEPNKIMIVFSDGCPRDSYSGFLRKKVGGSVYYVADRKRDPACTWPTAVNDTAFVIRRIRSKGIALMGIYYSNSEMYIEMEKTMFGNDFAYIKSIKNFVPQAIKYIRKQITKFDS